MSLENLLESEFQARLTDNVEILEQILEQSVDFLKREFIFYEPREISGFCFWTDGLVDTLQIEKILKSLMIYSSQLREETVLVGHLAKNIQKSLLLNVSSRLITKVREGIDGILSGDTLILLDRCNEALLVSTRGWNERSVNEAKTEAVVRGPQDGFTENIRTNTSQVRRRIRDPFLRIDTMEIGERTKTDVNVAYIKGIVKEGLVNEVKRRLESIQIDSILESGYIEELIEDAPLSPFTTIQSTERPDKAAAALLEGRVVIFVDNTPIVLIVPSSFWQYFQASDDYYSRYWVGSFFRFLRYIGAIISLTLPSIYIMLVSFHQEMIPTDLAMTIASGREAVPFPALIEVLIMELTFELLREAGLRLPKPVGQAVSIVGSLVIGQAAVQAGIVSPFMVIVTAITGISSFAIPNYGASFSIRILRFPLLLVSGAFGLLGFTSVLSMIILHALSLRSFGEPYLAPLVPFRLSDQKDVLLRTPMWSMGKRSHLSQGDPWRQAEKQMPQPPDKKRETRMRRRDTRK